MKKILFAMFIAVSVFAGVEAPLVQYTQADYCNDPHVMRADQNWFGAQLIVMDVHAGTDVWLTNYVSNFYNPVPDLHGNQFDMLGEQKYGYIFADSITNFSTPQGDYAESIIWGDGSKTRTVTYFSDDNPDLKVDAKGYYLDHFDNDGQVYLVMTTLPGDGGETVDSYQYVKDTGYDTSLVSRQHNTVDVAGNVRINFGIDSLSTGYIGREFVAVYEPSKDEGGHSSGAPLPGVMMSCLVGIGGIIMVRKKTKRG